MKVVIKHTSKVLQSVSKELLVTEAIQVSVVASFDMTCDFVEHDKNFC